MTEQTINAQTTGKKTKRSRITSKGRQIEPKALAEVRELLGNASRQKDLLIEHLHKIQDFYKHISAAHLVALAYEMKLSRAEVYEVATFYHHFDVIKEGDAVPADLTVRVCDSMTCEMAGAEGLIDSLETAMGEKVRVQRVPCIGRCDKAPVAVVGMHPVEFADVQKVDNLVEQGITEPETLAPILFEQYVANGGYSIYQQCMAGQHNVDKVLDMMDDSGLRGLGGAGFPVGRKWRIVRDQPAPRLMAVNID